MKAALVSLLLLQSSQPLEVTISPYLEEQDFKETFEHIYVELGDGRTISLGRWLTERLGPVDERDADEVLLDEVYKNLPGLPPIRFDKNRIQEGTYGDVLGAKHKGRSFINIAGSFNHDPTLNRPGVSLSRGIYGPPPINPLTSADAEFGTIDLSGSKKIRELFLDP